VLLNESIHDNLKIIFGHAIFWVNCLHVQSCRFINSDIHVYCTNTSLEHIRDMLDMFARHPSATGWCSWWVNVCLKLQMALFYWLEYTVCRLECTMPIEAQRVGVCTNAVICLMSDLLHLYGCLLPCISWCLVNILLHVLEHELHDFHHGAYASSEWAHPTLSKPTKLLHQRKEHLSAGLNTAVAFIRLFAAMYDLVPGQHSPLMPWIAAEMWLGVETCSHFHAPLTYLNILKTIHNNW